MITLRSIDRVYPLKGAPYYALRNINLEVKQGDFVSIMGPSGSGKSTLLHILGMHDSSWTGEYYFGEEAVHKLDKKSGSNFRSGGLDLFFRNIICSTT